MKTPRAMLSTFFVLLLLCSRAIGQDVHIWTGDQPAVPQITRFSVTGVWDADDDCTTMIGNKEAKLLEIGTAVDPADVAEKIAAQINANNLSDGLVDSEVRNVGPKIYGEFQDVTASTELDGGTQYVVLTGVVPGRPFTATVSENTTSTGALGTPTNVQDADGPNFADSAGNYHNDTLPVTDDTIAFLYKAPDCLYNLDQLASAEDLNFIRSNEYDGQIGLRATNTDWSGRHYYEYRARFLLLAPDTGTQSIMIGDVASPFTARGQTFLDFGTGGTTNVQITVHNAPAKSQTDGEAVQLVGGKDLQVTVRDGSVRLGSDVSENAIELLSLTLLGPGAYVHVADTADIDNTFDTIQQVDGTLIFEGDPTGATMKLNLNKGTATLKPTTGTINTATVRGGILRNYHNLSVLQVHDKAQVYHMNTQTMTTTTFHPGAIIHNEEGLATYTGGFAVPGGQVRDVQYHGPAGQTWSPSGP